MSNKVNLILFVTIFLSIVIGYTIFSFNKKQSLFNNYKITNAYVTQVNHGSLKGGTTIVKYFFYARGKKYESGIDSDLIYEVEAILNNSFFPVAYDSISPENNILLVSKERWKQLGLSFPDSLQWIEAYYPK